MRKTGQYLNKISIIILQPDNLPHIFIWLLMESATLLLVVSGEQYVLGSLVDFNNMHTAQAVM